MARNRIMKTAASRLLLESSSTKTSTSGSPERDSGSAALLPWQWADLSQSRGLVIP
jgi:hypothetical protein